MFFFFFFVVFFWFAITKTRLYNADPLKPHFNIVKLGLQGYPYFFYFCSKHRLWVFVRTRGGSNEYPQSVFFRNMKNISFSSENFQFWFGGGGGGAGGGGGGGIKFSVYLNRCVFVMASLTLYIFIFSSQI